MAPTRWVTPTGLADALDLLAAGGTVVGGGSALLSAAFPPVLGAVAVDGRDIVASGLTGDVVGASTTIAALAADPVVGSRWPAVAIAADLTANPLVRETATVGGTVAARLPSADLAAALAAHGAMVQLLHAAEPGDPVEVQLGDYLEAPGWPPHLVTGIRLTDEDPAAYRRFAPADGPTPALACVAGRRDDEGGIRLWAGACGPTAAPVPFAPGAPPAADRLRSDSRASATYRSHLVAVLAAEVVAALTPGPPS